MTDVEKILNPSPVDPYLIWGEKTNFRDYGDIGLNAWVSVAIECKEGEDVGLLIQRLSGTNKPAWLKISALYSGNPASFGKLKFCTVQVQRKNLNLLQSEVKRFELGMAIDSDYKGIALESSTKSTAAKSSSQKLVIGIIDDFIGFAHSTLMDANGSRVRHVWSQSSKQPSSSYWKPTGISNSYGFELDYSVAKPSIADLSKAYPAQLPSHTHGSHIASVAAGKLAYRHMGLDASEHLDAASKAPIIAVHLPQSTLDDSSGGSMNVHVLDGIRYILAKAHFDDFIVINISYSTHAGAHDGTSILEAAMDELIDLYKGRLSIVLPVGNHYELLSHAKFELKTKGGMPKQSQQLTWQVLPDCCTPSFMEVWLSKEHAQHIEIKLTDPKGAASSFVRVGNAYIHSTNTGVTDWAIVFPEQPSSSTKGVMALFAISPTRIDGNSAEAAAHGTWTVSLKLTDKAAKLTSLSVGVDAWIERNDTIKSSHRHRGQSYFVDAEYQKNGQKPGQPLDTVKAYVKRVGARNTIASGKQTIVVGGYRFQNAMAAEYSASSPDLTAPCDESASILGIKGAGTSAISCTRMNGTSVATPIVTRYIANYLAQHGASTKAQLLTSLKARFLNAPLVAERDGVMQVMPA
jgi:hypothetical protein